MIRHMPVYQCRKLNKATLVQAAGVFGVSVALGFIYQYVALVAAMTVHAARDVVAPFYPTVTIAHDVQWSRA